MITEHGRPRNTEGIKKICNPPQSTAVIIIPAVNYVAGDKDEVGIRLCHKRTDVISALAIKILLAPSLHPRGRDMRNVPDLSRVYHLRIGQLQYSYPPLASTCQKVYDKIAPKSIFNYRIILFLFHHICLTFKKWKFGELVEISHRDKCEILVFTAYSERRLNDEFRLAHIAEGVVIEVVKEEALIEISFDLTLAPSEAFLKCVVDSLCALVIGNSLF